MLPLLCTSYFYGKRLISTALLFTYEKRETLYAFICTSTVYFVKNLFFMKDSRNGNFMRSERRSVTFFSTTYFTYIHLSLTIVVSNKVLFNSRSGSDTYFTYFSVFSLRIDVIVYILLLSTIKFCSWHSRLIKILFVLISSNLVVFQLFCQHII